MKKRLAQVFVLGLMIIVPLLIAGCSDKQDEVEEYYDEYTVEYEQPIEIKLTIEHNVYHHIISDTVDKEVMSEETSVVIDEEELDLLAHLIYAEAGSNWCSDKMQQYTGSVVLNRMAHESYPDTMQEVIYQDGQYSCTWNGMIDYEYNERALECARFLLESGSVLPANVVYQAQFMQGDGLYEKVQNMYFCYRGEE